MTDKQGIWQFFLGCRKAASALEYAIVVGVVLAGLGGAVLGFVGDISTAMESMGISARSIEIASGGTSKGN